MLRYLRSYFFGPPGNAYKKFSTGNKPDESIFKKLFNSVLFSQESADTATTAAAGHVKVGTDANVKTRTDGTTDGHTRVVVPHQLANLEGADGTEASTIGVDVEEGGLIITPTNKVVGTTERKNFKVSANPDHSIIIDGVSKHLTLDGDEAAPDADKYYGLVGFNKGWFYPIPAYRALGATPYYLKAQGGVLSWVLGSAVVDDNYTILYNIPYTSVVTKGAIVTARSYAMPINTVTSASTLIKLTQWFEFVNAGLNQNYVSVYVGNGFVGFPVTTVLDGNTTGSAKIELLLNFGLMAGTQAVQTTQSFSHTIPSDINISRNIISPIDPAVHIITFYVSAYIRPAGVNGDILIHDTIVELFKS